RGNVDEGAWAEELAMAEVVEAGPATIYMLHILKELDLNPTAAGFSIVLSGHTHKPEQIERNGVLYLNPGSAGPGRFRLPISVARLDLAQKPWAVEFVELDEEQRPASS